MPDTQEVSFESAKAEAQGGNGAAVPEPTQTDAEEVKEQPEEEVIDQIDVIEPKVEPKEWTLGPPGEKEGQRTYVQRPLSFFAKMQFFSLVGEVIDKAISGEDGLRVGSLFEGPQFDLNSGGMIRLSDFSNADMFFQAVGKILAYAPDFLERSYCIWLSVPDLERNWAIQMMRMPVEDGGLSDHDGIEIVERFIDQNWEAIERFFREEIGSIRDRIQARRKTEGESPPSKP